jgi:DegV family protein with EDD domain
VEQIAIVTDSTSDLSPEIAAAAGIEVVPLSVIHQGKVYLDGIDITPDEFYPLLKSSSELPTTSQPTLIQFTEVYQRLLDKGYQIISVHISKGLSSTFETARSAAASLAQDRIHVVDSGFLSYGLAFQAIAAAKMALEGRALREVLEKMAEMKKKTELLFTLDTLHYLQKGGRIGKVSSLLGNLLNIKPIIRVEEGVYVPSGKTRSQKQALESMTHQLVEKFGDQPVTVAIGQGNAKESQKLLVDMVAKALNVQGEIVAYAVGPVLGVHTGPGCIGVGVCPVI